MSAPRSLNHGGRRPIPAACLGDALPGASISVSIGDPLCGSSNRIWIHPAEGPVARPASGLPWYAEALEPSGITPPEEPRCRRKWTFARCGAFAAGIPLSLVTAGADAGAHFTVYTFRIGYPPVLTEPAPVALAALALAGRYSRRRRGGVKAPLRIDVVRPDSQ